MPKIDPLLTGLADSESVHGKTYPANVKDWCHATAH